MVPWLLALQRREPSELVKRLARQYIAALAAAAQKPPSPEKK